jgi:cellulose synthase/poly-beta-1,6-N-acetylglucosamine synthase-like glycosyltransferase
MPMSVAIGQAVSCLSGRTAAYRTQFLKEVRDEFLNETFMGHHCMSGDDKCYTMLALQRGYRTVIQLNAHVYSTFKPTFNGFRKQRLRWARNSFRSDLKALWKGWIWHYPFLSLVLLDKTMAPFLLVFGPITLILSIALGHWHLTIALLIWWMASRAIKLISHFKRKPLDLLIIPAYIPVSWFMTLVRFQALFSLSKSDWLTRPVAMIKGMATRLSESDGGAK